MKKILILIFGFGFGQLINAQEKGLSLGFGGSLDIRLNDYYENHIGVKSQFSNILKSSVGIQINYQLNDRVGLRSGILYSGKGYKIIYKNVDTEDKEVSPVIPLESESRLNYVDIPLSIYCQVLKSNRYTLSPSLGIMNSVNIRESKIYEMRDGTRNEKTFNSSNTNKYLLGARLGLINNFKLSSNIFISFESYLIYELYNLNDTDIEKPEIPFGGILSVNYKFNKK